MMQSIIDRTRQQSQAQEQDEDRRVERLLKHIEKEQEFVAGVEASLEMRDRARFRRSTITRTWPGILPRA